LASGRDFYGSPALSPDGRRLAFCCWDHPRMPWDGAELVEVELGSDVSPGPARTVAGGPSESVTQPRYAPDGTLYFVSDRSGWWNLYRDASTAGGAVRPVVVADAEFAAPDWLFGNASYTFLDDGTVVATWTGAAGGALGRLEPGGSAFEPIETEFGAFSGIRSTGAGIVAIAGSPTRAAALVTLDPASGAADVIKASRGSAVDDGYLSTPRPLEYPTAGGRTAHALVYAPRNADFVAPDRERPPLIVAVHGGPTSAAPATLNYDIQYWTSRGFVVADVNYGGSTGLGREYRERLRGQWGVVDVEDAENVVRALVAAGEVDPARCVIHGGSAGGWTTLCALTFGDIFAAGASYFGVADLVGFAAETHKFESRYLDGLVGPAVGSEALYEERSPARHAEQIAVPLIVFQGLEDKIVPPNQSEVIVDALRAGGVPVAYLAYEGEQHGFRGAAAITRTAEAELYFYGRVFGFTPADELEPVEIENAEALTPPG
jgi:dipeptidyl aminopeptidase/acylaminoacyl peptidase